jgi:hypothetical protein
MLIHALGDRYGWSADYFDMPLPMMYSLVMETDFEKRQRIATMSRNQSKQMLR